MNRRTLVIGCTALVAATALAACGKEAPSNSAVVRAWGDPVKPGGTEQLHVTVGPVQRPVGDLVIAVGYEHQDYSLQRLTTPHNSRCFAPIKSTDAHTAYQYSGLSQGYECGPLAAGQGLSITFTYPINTIRPRFGKVRIYDGSACGDGGCDGTAELHLAPGSITEWTEGISQ
jgi:hypothetical protein